MKKFMSRRMKIFLSVLTLLSILCYISAGIMLYNSNFNFSSYSDDWNGRWNFDWSNHNSTSSIGTVEKELPQTVQNIYLSSSSSDYSVEFYSGTTLKIDVNGDFFSNFTYSDGLSRVEVTDSNVFIETNDNLIFSDLEVKVYVPDTYQNLLSIKGSSGELSVTGGKLKTLLVSSSSGDIDLYTVEATDTSLESLSGRINGSTIRTDKSLIKTASGDISISGALGETTVSVVSGSVDLILSEIAENSNFSTKSGDVDLIIPNEIGYKVNFSSISGEISGKNLNMDINNSSSYSFTNGDSSKLINVKTISGDLNLI
ncbi:DUF4097 family beta strand repeat-containing protein [Clostridium vincentii]|uniref:DUF4097 domain-containing protein n=1 Tax=Clostridium vincentii TaxID=52704 RepID=A0A2T0BKH9_9CLOT|nr:DUF4097 family beta strand repeat-containing protein [Clostridium vincentii]PRR84394.1 hypothetical protein CLVI_03200 [Clostridium vincentii]